GRAADVIGEPRSAAVSRSRSARPAPADGTPCRLRGRDALLSRRVARAARGAHRARAGAAPIAAPDAHGAATPLEADDFPARAPVVVARLEHGGTMKAAVMRAVGRPLEIEDVRID